MTVVKDRGRLLSIDGKLIGEGNAYVHVRQPLIDRQPVQGTLSLDWWDDAWSGPRARLELADGPTLAVDLDSDKISACVNGRILRYQATWPGTS
jgi:hypothetical protein